MPKKILIVDDSQVFRELEQVLLGHQGFELITAGDGVEAVRRALSEAPDLILLDLQMPVMTGKQALTILKGNPQTRDIPVVVVTTTTEARESEELLESGAVSVLSKPLDSAQLGWSSRSTDASTESYAAEQEKAQGFHACCSCTASDAECSETQLPRVSTAKKSHA